MDLIREELKVLGQDHVLKFYEELSADEKADLEADIREIDWKHLCSVYKKQVFEKQVKIDDNLLSPLPSDCVEGTARCESEIIEKYRNIGMNCIAQGKVAALLLAGGQGTRLGVDYPKGMYDIGLSSHKSLFQLQAERILKLSEPLDDGQKNQIIWYIMTSEATMKMSRNYFEANNFFGFSEKNVVFFEQFSLPCFDLDVGGKVLLAEKHKLCRSPNGNGGLYEALHKRGIINHMRENGVEFVHVYCVDNVLTKVCDPIFMGYCISKEVNAGAKVVEKMNPNEAVGIICKVSNQFKVIEYSEISNEVATRRDQATGKLLFNSGNICEHFFKVDFLNSINDEKPLRYHIAKKKIPHISLETGDRVVPTEVNGLKLEKFIFDVFEFTDKFAAWEVIREDEFSPLKNGNNSEKDNPTTALKALLRAYEIGVLIC